ncbi:MAG: coproporphyrinogen dehydrogenase HemZ [Christensenellales bacterium]
MITITTTNEKLNDELSLVLKLFYTSQDIEEKNIEFNVTQQINNLDIHTECSCSINDLIITRNDKIRVIKFPDRFKKRYAKLALFEMLQNIFPNKILPWGSLTGIRPTKLYYELIKELNGDYMKAYNELIDEFKVTPPKAQLVKEIIKNQKNIIKNDNLVDLYINIPFCPSKCYYCSFISAPIDKCRDELEPYLNALIKEIDATKQLILDKNYIVKSIYIGGGTPSILSPEQLDRLLSNIDYNVSEFTVECGRPDTITKEKLDVLSRHNVTRISINPQTFCNKTLKEIGRNHTAQDIISAYKLALNYNFSINMDLIAGLGNETLLTFKKSLNKAIECAPDNITVHTLSIKRGSELKTDGGDTSTEDMVKKMIDYSYPTLINAGYKPYYMYKQKNMLGNLENIGYFRDKPSIFNIDSMEEFASIIACGANAISKRYYSLENKIERFANLKNIQEYINRIDEMIEKKIKLFS